MKANMGAADKAIRVLIAIIIGVLVYTNVITQPFAIIALILAAVLVLTSLFSFCPLYTLFGLSTCKSKLSGK